MIKLIIDKYSGRIGGRSGRFGPSELNSKHFERGSGRVRNGPSIDDFKPDTHVKKWLVSRRSADHTACRAREHKKTDVNDPKYFLSLILQ